jgi:hypothetical protein
LGSIDPARETADHAAVPVLSSDLDRDDAQPYFIWDLPLTVADLRRYLAHPDPDTRALWMARVMREARYPDVWRFLSLESILAAWPRIERHLGRRRRFWEFLIAGWRHDGLIAG